MYLGRTQEAFSYVTVTGTSEPVEGNKIFSRISSEILHPHRIKKSWREFGSESVIFTQQSHLVRQQISALHRMQICCEVVEEAV